MKHLHVFLLFLALSFSSKAQDSFMINHLAQTVVLASEDTSSSQALIQEAIKVIVYQHSDMSGMAQLPQFIAQVENAIPQDRTLARKWWKTSALEAQQSFKEIQRKYKGEDYSAKISGADFPLLSLSVSAQRQCFVVAVYVLLLGDSTPLAFREQVHSIFLQETDMEKLVENYLWVQRKIAQNPLKDWQAEFRNEFMPLVLQKGRDSFESYEAFPKPWPSLQGEIELWAIGKLRNFQRKNQYHDGFHLGLRVPKAQYITCADHPAVLFVVQDEVKNALAKNEPFAREYLIWLKDCCSLDFWHTQATLPFLLTMAASQACPVPELNNENWIRQNHWLWTEVFYPAVESSVRSFDAHLLPERFCRLFVEHPRWEKNILGNLNCADVLFSQGKRIWNQQWNWYQEEAWERAGNVNTRNLDNLVSHAGNRIQTLLYLAGNPWSCPWVGQSSAATSLEASILLSWCHRHVMPHALFRSMDEEWPKLVFMDSQKTDMDKLASLDLFHPWETLRANLSQAAFSTPSRMGKIEQGKKPRHLESHTATESLKGWAELSNIILWPTGQTLEFKAKAKDSKRAEASIYPDEKDVKDPNKQNRHLKNIERTFYGKTVETVGKEIPYNYPRYVTRLPILAMDFVCLGNQKYKAYKVAFIKHNMKIALDRQEAIEKLKRKRHELARVESEFKQKQKTQERIPRLTINLTSPTKWRC